jgi:hypothetical protein
LPSLAPIHRLGSVGGIRVYEIAYSAFYHVVVWERRDWQFVPALIVDADDSIVARIYEPRVFSWAGVELLHQRILFEGTGHWQQSLFFRALGGMLVEVKEAHDNAARIDDYYRRNGLEAFHRGLGFCQDALVEVQLTRGLKADRVTRTYRVAGNQLVLDTLDLGEPKVCEIFPK